MEHSSTLITRLLNPFVKLLLRSPLHGIMSDNVILVTFTGRKSGKRYVTPVSYVREGNTITFLTHGSWWKNLRVKGGTGVRVLLRVRGRDVEGEAHATDDPKAVGEGIRAVLKEVPRDARFYGVRLNPDGEPDPGDTFRAAREAAVVKVHCLFNSEVFDEV